MASNKPTYEISQPLLGVNLWWIVQTQSKETVARCDTIFKANQLCEVLRQFEHTYDRIVWMPEKGGE